VYLFVDPGFFYPL